MQEVRDEITRRVAALERRNEWLVEQCADRQHEIDSFELERRANAMLADQYGQILDTIPATDSPSRT